MEPDIIVTCPYNPAHRIRQYKLMSHVVKCKKSADTKNKVECPLNKSHIVDHDHLRVRINLYIYTIHCKPSLFTCLLTLCEIILLKIFNIFLKNLPVFSVSPVILMLLILFFCLLILILY